MTKSSWCSGVAAGGLVQQKQRDGGNGQWILMDYIVNEGKGGINKGFYPHAVQCSHKIRKNKYQKKKRMASKFLAYATAYGRGIQQNGNG